MVHRFAGAIGNLTRPAQFVVLSRNARGFLRSLLGGRLFGASGEEPFVGNEVRDIRDVVVPARFRR